MNKRAQDIPGWTFIVGLIIGLLLLGLIIFFIVKSGSYTSGQLGPLK